MSQSSGPSPETPSAPAPGRCRWLCSRKCLGRCLFVLACLATVIALFYTEENWRGKRAWEKCRHELEAKGETLDWSAYIPAPVPDEQNIFKAPKMQEWFVKQPSGGFADVGNSKSAAGQQPFTLARQDDTNNLLLAEVQVLPSDAPLRAEQADAVLRYDEPAAREQAEKLLHDVLGPCPQVIAIDTLIARSPEQIKPLRLVVLADAALTPKALAGFFQTSPTPPSPQAPRAIRWLDVAPAGSNSFRVWLKAPVYGAADYLARSEPLTPDFDMVRRALERPCARMDGDYRRPFQAPIPNFVRMRTVAQLLSQRAQCYLLLGQSESAWHELALIREMCRLLHNQPGDRPMPLVAAMIDTAITGLYVEMVDEGLRSPIWREPELVAIQRQLESVNLLRPVVESFRAERAALCRTLETTSSDRFAAKIFKLVVSPPNPSLWEGVKQFIGSLVPVPYGWKYQNMAFVARHDQQVLSAINSDENLVLPRQVDEMNRQLVAISKHFSPYTFLAAIVVPNYLKASQTVARNQTQVNEALIACALERYRLVHGQYPETLDALAPQFLTKLPHDLIGGQPLKYHRTADGKFLLYSVGWNEKDDGGIPGKTLADGDWVWEP